MAIYTSYVQFWLTSERWLRAELKPLLVVETYDFTHVALGVSQRAFPRLRVERPVALCVDASQGVCDAHPAIAVDADPFDEGRVPQQLGQPFGEQHVVHDAVTADGLRTSIKHV